MYFIVYLLYLYYIKYNEVVFSKQVNAYKSIQSVKDIQHSIDKFVLNLEVVKISKKLFISIKNVIK